MSMESEGREDVNLDLRDIDKVASSNIVIKEGVEFRLKISFRIQHEVVAGLKYIQVVKRAGLRVDKSEEMIGSYGPRVNNYDDDDDDCGGGGDVTYFTIQSIFLLTSTVGWTLWEKVSSWTGSVGNVGTRSLQG